MSFLPLTKEEITSVIEGHGAAHRVPMMYHFWADAESFGNHQTRAQDLLNRYPYDVCRVQIEMPEVFEAPTDDPQFRWAFKDSPLDMDHLGIDERVAIDDWKDLDRMLDNFPDPYSPHLFPDNPPNDGRYRLGSWWYLLFERLWSLRGMSNAMMDFYLYPKEIHRLLRRLTDFYLIILERGRKEYGLDGMIVSDDIGTQTGPFFSLEMFEEFFKPYYKELIEKAHSLGMHFWLHSCGNIQPIIPHLIEIGLDVLHPIQKYTMDERQIADVYGDQICIWAGFDVQQIIPFGSPEDVRQEVRFMIDTYYRSDGRLILTSGNGITSDTPIDSFEALLDESYVYGSKKKASN